MYARGFFAWVAILGLIPAVLKLAISGAVSASEAALLLIVMIGLLASSRRLFAVAAPFISVYVFVRSFALQNHDATIAIATQILTLSIMLLGMWIMFRGLMPSKRRRT